MARNITSKKRTTRMDLDVIKARNLPITPP
jgi:hypothetical protein